MDDLRIPYDAWVLASVMALAMILAWLCGRRIGRWLVPAESEPSEPKPDLVSSKLGAYLTMLSLLLGFTFSMSLNRHEARILMVVADSNAIGDFYTCATLLKEPVRTELQTVVRQYAELHLNMARQQLDRNAWVKALQTNKLMQDQMTKLVSAALSDGTPIAVPLTNTLNGVTSSSAARLVAVENRVPGSVVLLLFLFAIVTTGLDGFEQGSRRSASPVELVGISSFIALVALAVYVTLDLDQPAGGLINVSQASVERLVSSLTK